MIYFILGLFLGWILHGIVEMNRQERQMDAIRKALMERIQVEVEQTKEDLEKLS